MSPVRQTTRALVALAGLVAVLAVLAPCAVAAPEPWGTLGNLRVPAGTTAGKVSLREEESAVAVDSADGSFFVADALTNEKTHKHELRLQRFTSAGKAEPSAPTTLKVPGEEEEGQLLSRPELAVDAAHDRVYMLVSYYRLGENAKEEKEETTEEAEKRTKNKVEVEKAEVQLAKVEANQEAHTAPVRKLRTEENEALEKNETAKAEEKKRQIEETEDEPKYRSEEEAFVLEEEALHRRIHELTVPLRREPLDSEEYVAGALYAWEFSGGKLNPANTAEKGLVLGAAGFQAQGETAKEALLNPLGLTVDPKTGNVVVLGVQDQQSDHNAVAQATKQKECRVAAQWLTMSGAAGAVTAKLARRYVDTANVIGHADHDPGKPENPASCGGYAEQEPTEWQAYTPVVTAGGKLMAMSTNSSFDEGVVWELPGAYAEEHAEQAITPAQLYTYPVGQKLEIDTGAEEPVEAMMSPAMSAIAKAGAETEGQLYVGARFEEEHPPASSGQIEGVVVLHYSEAGGHVTLGEEGYVTGFHAFEDAEKHVKPSETEAEFLKGRCGLPSPFASTPSGLGAGVIPVGAFLEKGKEAVLEMSSGARDELTGVKLAPGGVASECLSTAPAQPTITVGSVKDPASISVGTEALLESEVFSGPAKSAEWTFKYTNGGKTETEPPVVQNEAELAKLVSEAREAGTVTRIKHVFSHEGEYEVTVKVTPDGSNLVSPTGEATATPRKVATKSSLKAVLPEMKSITAGESASDIEARVTDPTLGDHIKYVWRYGDEGKSAEKEFTVEKTETGIKSEPHLYKSACACKVEFQILSPSPVVASRTITVKAREEEHKEEHKEEEHKEEEQKVESPPTTTGSTPPPPGGGVLHFTEGTPEAKVAGSALSVSPAGALNVSVTCGGGARTCTGRITLQTLTAVATSAKKKAKKKILTLAAGSFSVTAGATKKLTLHLSSQARALLGHAHSLRARAIMVARNAEMASHTTTAIVTLKLAAKKTHH